MKPAKVNFNTVRSIFFFGLIAVLLLAMLFLFKPFFYPIFWAAVIAVIFKPVFNFFLHHIKLPSLSSIITIIIIIAVLFLPLTILTLIAANESTNIINRASSGGFLHNIQNAADQLKNTALAPYIGPALKVWDEYAVNLTQKVSTFIFQNIADITKDSLTFIFMLFVTFYTLFFFLKDGTKILKKIMHISPLGDEYETLLYEKFTSTARATLKTTLIVGAIQGTLGGILFWITGINGAIIWGILMTALSIVPGIGSFIVWLPTGIIMLALGHTWQGVTILIAGSLIISTIDNIIRPPLLGKDIQMHPLIAFFSTLGGLFLFGISGFVIGPVIASLCLSVVSIYDYYYKKELKDN